MDGIVQKMELPRKARIQEFDFFSEGVGLNFGGQERGKSILGTFFTLIILGCFGFLFQYYLMNMLETSSPKLRFDQITDTSTLNFNNSNADFKFFMLFSDPSTKVVTSQGTVDNLADSYVDDSEVADDSSAADGSSADGSASDSADGSARRRLEKGSNRRRLANSPDNFLSFNESNKYYVITAKYIQSKNSIEKGKPSIKRTEVPVKMIQCKDSVWFKDPKLQPYLNKNPYAKQIIQDNGFCFDMHDKFNIYGNWLSASESSISIQINLCVPTSVATCDPKVWERFSANDQYAYLGSFSSAVDNSNKEDPFVYDYYFHQQLILSTQMTNLVKIRYKKLDVVTDLGILFDDLDKKSVGIIEEVSVQNLNSYSYDLASSAVVVNQNQVVAKIDIRGSALIDQYTRTYDKIFDFIGNLGGAMELVILSCTILYCHLSGYLTGKQLHHICKTELGFQELCDSRKAKASKKAKKGCCRKSKDKQEMDLDEYTEELAEGSLSFETLVKNNVYSQLLQHALIPPELIKIAPYLFSLEKAHKQKLEAEQKKTNNADKNKVFNKSADQSIERANLKKSTELTFEEAIDQFASPLFEQQNPAFINFKKKYMEYVPVSPVEYENTGKVQEVVAIDPIMESAEYKKKKVKVNTVKESLSGLL